MTPNVSVEPNLSLLLEPIPGKNPCGDPLRYTEVYDQIRDARREDDEKLPQGVWKTEIKKADWEQVDHLCQEALKNRSKDLQIAAWLTEAWLHLEGIGGLARGLDLILGLSKTFWTGIHPQMNEGGYELRIVPYEWINTRLSEDSPCAVISAPSDRTALPYRLLDFTEANRLELSAKRSPAQGASQPPETKQPSLAKISLSIDQTSTAFYRYMDENCMLALKLMLELEEELRLHLGGESPTFYRLREKVEALQRFATHVLDERGEKKGAKKAELDKSSPIVPQSHKKHLSGSIENREQAYIILGEVASYLERIEPHSPTPYLIHRAISWGDMSLSQVFADILTNGRDLSLLLDILNVKKEQ